MATVEYREDPNGVYLFVDVFDVPAHAETYAEVKSKPEPPNASTEGVTASLHKTASADGKVTFRIPRDFILPDFPREVTTTISHATGTAVRDFTA